MDALRKENALDLSLVAEFDGKIVGHIAFSKVTIEGKNDDWYGLAPVSVLPEYEKMGIGSKLIMKGLERLKNLGANGCVLLGEPEYYNRFGFRQADQLTLEGVPAEYFLALSFQERSPSGKVQYHDLFTKYG